MSRLPFNIFKQGDTEYEVVAHPQVVYEDTITGTPSEVLTAISSNVSADILANPRTVIQLTQEGEIYYFHNDAKVRSSYSVYNCVNNAMSGISGFKALIRKDGGTGSTLHSITLTVPSTSGAVQGAMVEVTRSSTYGVKVTTM